MENLFLEIVLKILLCLPLVVTTGCMIASAIFDYKRWKAVEVEVQKASDKVEAKIDKQYEEAMVENNRLKKLCDRTLAVAEKTEEELAKLRAAKAELKKENRELREKLLEKSEPTKIKVK